MNLSVPTKKTFYINLKLFKLTKMKNSSIAAVLFLIIYSCSSDEKKMSNLEYNSDTQLYNAAMSYLKPKSLEKQLKNLLN